MENLSRTSLVNNFDQKRKRNFTLAPQKEKYYIINPESIKIN